MMGNACCCFGYEEIGSDHLGSSHGCFRGLVYKCRALFGRGIPAPPFDEEAIPLESEGLQNGSSPTSPTDVTLPMDQNPRFSDDVVRGQDRGSSHSQAEDPVPRTIAVQQQPKLLKVGNTLFNTFKPEKSKEQCSDSSLKVFSSVELSGVEYLSPSSEDEDVCPTCLEEYTEENPKIITHCMHHYHLSCIYEWMERSDTCPVCGKLMEFDE